MCIVKVFQGRDNFRRQVFVQNGARKLKNISGPLCGQLRQLPVFELAQPFQPTIGLLVDVVLILLVVGCIVLVAIGAIPEKSFALYRDQMGFNLVIV